MGKESAEYLTNISHLSFKFDVENLSTSVQVKARKQSFKSISTPFPTKLAQFCIISFALSASHLFLQLQSVINAQQSQNKFELYFAFLFSITLFLLHSSDALLLENLIKVVKRTGAILSLSLSGH